MSPTESSTQTVLETKVPASGYETIHDMDFDGEVGSVRGFHIFPGPGQSVEDLMGDALDLFLDEEGREEFYDNMPALGFDASPTHVARVPYFDDEGVLTDSWTFSYSAEPREGYRACLLVEAFSFWGFWCTNHCYEPATTGVPVERVADPVWPKVLTRITAPENRLPYRRGPQDGHPTVYLCRECSTDFNKRHEQASREAMEAYRREAQKDQDSLPTQPA